MRYDLLVVGGGAGGLTAAKTAVGFGKKVLILEKNKLGGECTWTGCVPSKALIKAAQVAHDIKYAGQVGIKFDPVFKTDGVMNYVRSIVQDIYNTQTPEKLKQIGIDVLIGNGQFIDAHRIQVANQTISFDKCIIATGSRPFVPPIERLKECSYLTNETLFDLKEIPQSMLILGGGAIGAEMASALNRLGCEVTIVEMQPRILAKEDEELVKILSDYMEKEGVRIKTGMRATRAESHNGKIRLTTVDSQDQTHEFEAQYLLVAVGRSPNIKGLGLDQIGVQTHKKGIVVNNYMRTSVSNIYAIGDVVGPYLFSHIAWHQAVTAVRNAFIPIFKKRMSYKNIMWVTFTAPELASVGLTEQEARKQYGNKITVYRQDYTSLDRAHTDHALIGRGKFICDAHGRLIGAQVLGKRAGEVIHELQLLKVVGKPFASLMNVIHAYPTYSELPWYASKQAFKDRLEKNWLIQLARRFISR